MASPISEDSSDLPSPKLQKIEANSCEDYDYDVELQQFNDEFDKSEGFEMDFSKLTNWFNCRPVDLDESTILVDEPETYRDLIAIMAHEALTQRNAENGTSLELGKILRAMSNVCTNYISFEVKDPSESDGNQTKPFRAVVGYWRRDYMIVYSCFPKPSL